MNFSGIMTQLISLFLMMLTGYLLARIGMITQEFRKKLSSFTLNTASPCVIISSVLESKSTPGDLISAVGIAIIVFLLLIVTTSLVVRLIRTPKEERGLDQLLIVFTNIGFMGIPVIQSLYGPEGVALLSMFILTFNLVFFSYGVILIQPGAKLSFRKIINPCIIAAVIAFFLGLTGLHLPIAVEKTLSSIGAMNTPLAMMIIGSSLAFCDIRTVLSNKRLYRIGLLRMVVMPLIVLFAVRFLPISSMLAGICVICAAMPSAGNCAVLYEIHVPNDLTASYAVIITTLLSALTLPVICTLVLYLL